MLSLLPRQETEIVLIKENPMGTELKHNVELGNSTFFIW